MCAGENSVRIRMLQRWTASRISFLIWWNNLNRVLIIPILGVTLDAKAGIKIDAFDVDALLLNHPGGEHRIGATGNERDRFSRSR